MDETCVRLNNSSILTLAPARTKVIPNYHQKNDKKAITVIVNITKNTTHKIIVLSKGSDEKSII